MQFFNEALHQALFAPHLNQLRNRCVLLELQQKAQIGIIEMSVAEDGRFIEEEELVESDLNELSIHPNHSQLIHALLLQVVEGEDAHK